MIFRFASVLLLLACTAMPARAEPETVYFKSADGQTDMVGYLFKPKTPGPHPAIVLLHGRAGPYSANFNKDCTQVARGDQFAVQRCDACRSVMRCGASSGPRAACSRCCPTVSGRAARRMASAASPMTIPDRDEVNEKTVRPLDAEGALAYLRAPF